MQIAIISGVIPNKYGILHHSGGSTDYDAERRNNIQKVENEVNDLLATNLGASVSFLQTTDEKRENTTLIAIVSLPD